MRELDVLLNQFIDTRYATLSPAELDLFDRFLEQSDVDLYAWFTGRETPVDVEFARLVSLIGRAPES